MPEIKAIYMQLHCVVCSVLFLSRPLVSPSAALLSRLTVAVDRRGTPAWPRTAGSVSWNHAKSRTLSALTKASLALEARRCAGQGSRVIGEFLSARLRIDFSCKTLWSSRTKSANRDVRRSIKDEKKNCEKVTVSDDNYPKGGERMTL